MYANERRIGQTCESPMASTSTSSSSSTQKYEVFLCFRGEDTRYGFTSHLYDALKRLGIVVFRDDEKLEKGEEVHPYLKGAIERSQYAVVIISERFAESKSCLIELSVIMERRRKGCITVFPVFYHVEPYDVRNQKGKFGEYLAQLKDDANWEIWKAVLIQVGDCTVDFSQANKDTVESCGGVLKEVSNLCGWHVQNRDESEIVKEISEKIFAGLIHNSTNIDKSFVGIDSQAKKIMELLHLDLGGVRYIGISGIGGIGKTTLAEVIYQIASFRFEACSFVLGIGKTNCLEKFKKQLIYEILSKDVIDSLSSENHMDRVLRSRLKNKKVLIVLDDIWDRKQIDALAKAEWFGKGSRIIITSRSYDWPCLNKDNIYEVNPLNDEDALQLFNSKAFPKHYPEEKFQWLSKKIVHLAKGHPLALEVSGSYLSNKEKDDWEGYLNQLKANPDQEVKNSLQITFDRMKGHDQLRDAFLDVICFFYHTLETKGHLRQQLVWLGYPSNILTDLERKCLIKFTKFGITRERVELYIHDLLLQMGQEIAEQERLWRTEDFISALKGNAGKVDMHKLKIIRLMCSSFNSKQQLCVEAFAKMKNLRILEIFDCFGAIQWRGECSELKLSKELCYVHWIRYPFESLPTGFNPINLSELKLSSHYFKQLSNGGSQCFLKLKKISFSFLTMLETPDLSQAPYLEELSFANCSSISSIHQSIRLLKHLKTLSFIGCENIERFPDGLVMESLETLCLSSCPKLEIPPDTFGEMSSLRHIHIYNTSFEKFPFSFQRLPNLEKFYLEETHVGKLPVEIIFSREEKFFSIEFSDTNKSLELPRLPLSSLKCQVLNNCILSRVAKSGDLSCYDGHKELLETLFSSLKSLLTVRLINCNLDLVSIPKSIGCWSISILDLSKNRFMELPDSIYELSNLKELILSDCTSLQVLPKLPLSLQSLELSNCPLLKVFNRKMDGVIPNCWSSIKCLNLGKNRFTKLPNTRFELFKLKMDIVNQRIAVEASSKMGYLHLVDVRNCSSLEARITSRISTVMSGRETSMASVCSFTIVYIGFDYKPHKILCLRPQAHRKHLIECVVACGPTAEARIPEAKISEWSIHRSTSSNKRIQVSVADAYGEHTIAMLIYYKVHGCYTSEESKRNSDKLENLNIGAAEDSNRNLREFICELQVTYDDSDAEIEDCLVFCMPKVALIGSHGVWVFINMSRILKYVERWKYSASITATSENVELKECGVRLLKRDAGWEFSQVVNHISLPGLDSKIIVDSLDHFPKVRGLIKQPSPGEPPASSSKG